MATIAERGATNLIARSIAEAVDGPGASPTGEMREQAVELLDYLKENGYAIVDDR